MRFWLRGRFFGAASASPAKARHNAVRKMTEYLVGFFVMLFAPGKPAVTLSRNAAQRRSFESLRQEFFECMPRTPVGSLVVLHAGCAIVCHRVGERMHRLAIGMHLPISARSRELLRDREHVFRRGHRIVVAMKYEYPGTDFRFRESRGLQHPVETDHAAHLGIRTRHVERTQAAEAETHDRD